jgi:hypothetical protein
MTTSKMLTGALAACAITAPPALAAEPADWRQSFLACERQASRALLGSADAARCSTAYEQLLRREFQGDFRKFLAWWEAQPRQQAQAPAAEPPL